MNKLYQKPIKYWNDVFQKSKVTVPSNKTIGIKELDEGLDWLNEDIESLIDFGCGNGSMLFYSALRGTKKFFGVDLSEEAINKSIKRAALLEGHFDFLHGDINQLKQFEDHSIDGMILSNIIDNLTEEDMFMVLKETHRIIKKQGKIFIKVNPYIEKSDFEQSNIKEIEGDLLDDGLLLLNKTTKDWEKIFSNFFTIEHYKIVHYPQYDMTNRLFLLYNK